MLARITATAPLSCAFLTLIANEQPPRFMRATLPVSVSEIELQPSLATLTKLLPEREALAGPKVVPVLA